MAHKFFVNHELLRTLSLGAGVQSTTLLLMSLNGEFETMPDAAIFADTGWEPKAVYQHLEWLEQAVSPFPIYRVRNGNIRETTIGAIQKARKASLPFHLKTQTGQSAMARRQCTNEYKLVPLRRKIRELAGLKPRQHAKGVIAECWIGISFDEMLRMKPSRESWLINRFPLIEKRMTRTDCIRWLTANGYPIPPKSSCIGCPFHDDRYWRNMKLNNPSEFEEAVEFDSLIRRGLKNLHSDAYLHRSLQPLSLVDFRNAEDKGQLAMDFIDECEGMCGV